MSVAMQRTYLLQMIHLIFAKAKTAPVKPRSLPTLELMAVYLPLVFTILVKVYKKGNRCNCIL